MSLFNTLFGSGGPRPSPSLSRLVDAIALSSLAGTYAVMKPGCGLPGASGVMTTAGVRALFEFMALYTHLAESACADAWGPESGKALAEDTLRILYDEIAAPFGWTPEAPADAACQSGGRAMERRYVERHRAYSRCNLPVADAEGLLPAAAQHIVRAAGRVEDPAAAERAIASMASQLKAYDFAALATAAGALHGRGGEAEDVAA